MTDARLAEGFTYTLDWTPALTMRALRPRSGQLGHSPIKLSLPFWFWLLIVVMLVLPVALVRLGVIAPETAYAFPLGMLPGAILVGAFFIIIQRQAFASTKFTDPVPMEVTIAPTGISLNAPHFRNSYTWHAVDRVGEGEEGLLIWMHALLITIVPDEALPDGTDRTALMRQIEFWRAEAA